MHSACAVHGRSSDDWPGPYADARPFWLVWPPGVVARGEGSAQLFHERQHERKRGWTMTQNAATDTSVSTVREIRESHSWRNSSGSRSMTTAWSPSTPMCREARSHGGSVIVSRIASGIWGWPSRT